MSGLRDFISKASAIFRSLGSLKPGDRILKLFKLTGLCPVLKVCCPRRDFSHRCSLALTPRADCLIDYIMGFSKIGTVLDLKF